MPEPVQADPLAIPAVRAVLLRVREEVADTTYRALVDLRRLGVDDPLTGYMIGGPDAR